MTHFTMTENGQGLSEFELLSEVRKGSEKGFEALFKLYKDRIYAFSYKILKSKDLADDMVIEVFTKIWENKASIQPDLSFKAYLFRITKNHIINFLNKASLDARTQEHLTVSSNYYRSTTEEEVIYNEYITLAEQAICQMPKQRRVIFKLRNERGMSYQEIANHLGISKNTVKSHLMAARTHLRGIFTMHPNKTAILLVLLTEISEF